MAGGSENTSSQSSSAPAWVMDYGKSYLDKANDVSNTPYSQSPTQTVDPNATQNTAWDAIQNRALSGSPELSNAKGQLNTTLGGGYMGQGVSQNANAGAYNPQANSNWNPYGSAMNANAGVQNQQAGAANPFAQSSNPYLQQSIDAAQGDVVRNYNNVVKPQSDASAIRSGSFGNSGIQSQQLDEQNQLQQNLGNISNNMRSADYNQRAALNENATNRQYQAGAQTQANLFNAGSQQNQNQFNSGAQGVANQFNAGSQYAQNQFNAGQQYAGDQNNAFQAERGRQTAGLGQALGFANQDYTDANQLLQAGNQQGQFAQNQANQNYNWWQEGQNYPTNKLNTLGNAIGTVAGTGRTTTSTSPGTSAGAGLLGGGILGSQLGSGISDSNGGNYGGWGAGIGSLLGLFGR